VIGVAKEGGSAEGGFGAWAWVGLTTIFVTALYTDVSRFQNPAGEKYTLGYFEGGQADFTYPYLGARALLAHQHPYRTTSPEYTHHLFRLENVNGVPFRQIYPPGHLLTYLPLVLIYGKDAIGAARCFFHICLIALLLMGVLTFALVRSVRGLPVSPLFIFLAAAALLTQPGVQLGLERGQSDILTALLCWTAIFFATRQKAGLALFFIVWATSIKGYPFLLAAGMGVMAMRRKVWRRALVGFAAGAAVFVVPVVRYLGDGLRGVVLRSNLVGTDWYNHGFNSAVEHLVSARAADTGRVVLAALSLLITLLWGWRAWQRRNEGGGPAATFSLVMFATAALTTAIGVSKGSVSYNLIIVLPGAIALAATQDRAADFLSVRPRIRHLLGAVTTFGVFALFLGRWHQTFPASALGLLVLLALLAALGIRMPSPAAIRVTLPHPATATPAAASPGYPLPPDPYRGAPSP
jgi:hypothetical protein